MKSRWSAAGVIVALAVAAGAWFWLSRDPLAGDATAAAETARRLIGECRFKPKDEVTECYQAGLDGEIKAGGVGRAMAVLKALVRGRKDVDRDSHVYAHGIGIAGYQLAKSVPGTFDQCSIDFASGCFHGVLQAYLQSQSAVDSASINALCAPYHRAGASRWMLFQCVHGMGHGLQMMYGGDLPQSLTSCDQLTDDWDRSSCYGGAFMENIMHAIAPHHPATKLAEGHEHHHEGAVSTFKAVDSTDLLYPCSIVAPKYHRSCYEIQTSAILHFTDGDVGRAARACDTAPENMRPICYLSLGRDVSSKARRNPAKSIGLCRDGGDRYLEWCYFGLAKALIDWNADPEDGLAMCRMVGNGPGWERCFQAVGEQLATLYADSTTRARGCASAGRPEAVAVCRKSALVDLVVVPVVPAT